MPNSKMLFIRNYESFQEGKNEESIEFEVIVDAHIIGVLKSDLYCLNIWDFGYFEEGEERKLCLKIKSNRLNSHERPETSRNGYYHGGDIADEIVALSSLFLRRKIKLSSIVRRNDIPMRFSHSNEWIDRPLICGESNLEMLTEWFDLIKGLKQDLHQKFILASRLYHRAILLIEDEPDLAYLNLVSSIEVLCQDTDIGNVTLADVDLELAKLVNSLDVSVRQNIEEKILKREKFIKRKFVKFILDHVEDSFWSEERPQYGKIEADRLAEYLGRIYKQRSKTLHNGEPFPPSIHKPPLHDCEIDFSLGVSVGERRWEPQDFIPHPHFFERLINHVLKVYLKKNVE